MTALAVLVAAYPLWRAWRANRQTTLRGALLWAWLAWLAWLAAAWQGGTVAAYAAVALTGCAGVAVLGARRPGAGAWHFVVAGLLAALLLPLAEGWGRPNLETTRLAFLVAVLGAGLGNYLPTRLAPAAVLLGAGCALATLGVAGVLPVEAAVRWGVLPAALAPWAALAALAWRPAPASPLDRDWLAFRDRFGGLWGLRQREQFNRAAANAALPVELGWCGLRLPEGQPRPEAAALALLRATLKRFDDSGE